MLYFTPPPSFLGAKAPLGIARVKKKRHEKVSELNDFIMVVK